MWVNLGVRVCVCVKARALVRVVPFGLEPPPEISLEVNVLWLRYGWMGQWKGKIHISNTDRMLAFPLGQRISKARRT